MAKVSDWSKTIIDLSDYNKQLFLDSFLQEDNGVAANHKCVRVLNAYYKPEFGIREPL